MTGYPNGRDRGSNRTALQCRNVQRPAPPGGGAGARASHVGGGVARTHDAVGEFRPGADDRDRKRQDDAMTGNKDSGQTAQGEDVRRAPAEAVEPAPEEVPWLLRHKLGLPDPVEGYVERPELEERCALLDRRLTVLHAAGGFGKTALLARCCRALREQGIAVAWLSLDEEDGPGSLATHLAHAFEEAGLATFGPAGERGGATAAPDPQADS